jgi:hypothetical protein
MLFALGKCRKFPVIQHKSSTTFDSCQTPHGDDGMDRTVLPAPSAGLLAEGVSDMWNLLWYNQNTF